MELHSLCTGFVWRGKKPQLAMALLQGSKQNGGLGLPNGLQYYQVIVLQRVFDWKFHTASKLWVLLSCPPWVPSGDRRLSDWMSTLTNHSYKVWDRLNRSLAFLYLFNCCFFFFIFSWFVQFKMLKIRKKENTKRVGILSKIKLTQ